jgi:hypothetical protein
MDIVDFKHEFKNSKILLIVLGTLLIPVINSVDSLLAGLYEISGLSIKSGLILSTSFHGLIIVFLLCTVYWTISFRNQRSGQPKVFLSRRTLVNWGAISFLILIAGVAINVYIKKYYDEAPDLSQIDTGGLTITAIAYLTMTQTGLMILRNVLLFTIYFVIVFKRS